MWAFLGRKLSRVTSSGTFIPEIDGLRFIAILAVVILHATYQGLQNLQGGSAVPLPADWAANSGNFLIRLFSGGWVGVQVFFVISGFILALPFARQHLTGGPKVSIRRYFSRRVTRIEPPYFICLTVALLIRTQGRRALLPHYFAGLGYLHQIVFHHRNPLLVPAWSLEVEVFFYLLAPWLCSVFLVRQTWVRRGVLAAFLLTYSNWAVTGVISARSVLDYTLAAALQFFVAGMLLADLYVGGVFQRGRGLIWSVMWDLAAIGGIAGLVYSTAWEEWELYWLSPIFIMLLVGGAFQGAVLNRLMRLEAVTVVGGMCYSIYLWHTIVNWFTGDFLKSAIPRDWPMMPAVLSTVAFDVGLALIVGAAMFYFVEKPFMNGPGSRLLERLFQKRELGPGAPARSNVGRDGAGAQPRLEGA
jgi:peptidoglycan/LPS O-acetylase OafA/YrhL